MLIEHTIRRVDGTKVLLGETQYHFAPFSKDDPRHIANVDDPDHIKRFLSIVEGYQIPTPAPVSDVSNVVSIRKRGRPKLNAVSKMDAAPDEAQ